VELVVVDQALEPATARCTFSTVVSRPVLRLVALRHEARDHPAQRPDPEARLHVSPFVVEVAAEA
jgi:hypothetical protein